MNSNIIKTKRGTETLYSDVKTPQPRPIFGNYVYEKEMVLLFGERDAGKSILANDIAFFVSGGGHEWDGMTSPNIPCLYIDLGMTEQQFAVRYENAEKHITDKYIRAEVIPQMGINVYPSIETLIVQMQEEKDPPKFIIIDDVLGLIGGSYSAPQILKLMSSMKALKSRYDLTILLIVQSRTKKNKVKITELDLGGSKMISLFNFVDSAFAVAPSLADDSLRYIKQIKTRESQKMPNVITVKITNEPYLCMEYKNMCREEEHLKTRSDEFWFLEITPEIEPILMGKLLEDNGILHTKDLVELGISYEAVRGYARMYNIDVCLCY